MNSLNGGMLGSLNSASAYQQQMLEEMWRSQSLLGLPAQGSQYSPTRDRHESIEPRDNPVLLLLA